MRILLVSDAYPPERIGGIGYIVESLRNQLINKNHEVLILTSGYKSQELINDRIYKTHSRLLVSAMLNNFIIIKWVLQKKIDIINLHQTTSNLFLVLFPLLKLFRFKVPVVINSLQVDYIQEFRKVEKLKYNGKNYNPVFSEYKEKYLNYPIHIFIDWIGYAFSDLITVVSKQNATEISKNYGLLRKKKTVLIPNGIDVDRFKYSENTFDGNILQLIFIGSFRVRKRIFHMVELIRILKDKYKLNIVLNIVGSGRPGYDEKIKDLIQEYGLQENIVLHGKVLNEDIPDLLKNVHLFLLISSYEGLSVAMLEALGSGKVVVSTDIYGSKDVITHGEDGILIPLDNIEKCAEEINTLYKNPDKIKQISKNAYHLINQYSWEEIGDQYLNLYKETTEL